MRARLVFSMVLVTGCAAHETRMATVDDARAVTIAPMGRDPIPFPETAFRGNDATPPSPTNAPRDRFETRRIGPSSGDSKSSARYRGARIDLDLKNAELSEAFRLLSDVGHVNIVVSGEVSGTITMRLKQVPWDQALAVIVRAKGLALERDGNVLIVHGAGK